jgi:catalase
MSRNHPSPSDTTRHQNRRSRGRTGEESVRTLSRDGKALHFVAEAFKHYKAVGAVGAGTELLDAARVPQAGRGDADRAAAEQGVVTADTATGEFLEEFANAVAAHRHFGRDTSSVPA